ncbi:MAG: DUF4760 domain-containing protein [Alphaproteobacteria bacterium]|nr:DUF4760 domain-containing protein [Alphaproteobacteria bacterium]
MAPEPQDLVVHCQCATEYGPWITAGAILISASVAACAAIGSIREQRKIAKKRATLDLLSRKEWDSDYIEARKVFLGLRDEDPGLVEWAKPEHRKTPQVTNIKNTLNDYELIAIGIKENILDEELYKRWFRSSFLKDWHKSRDFIVTLRERDGVPTLFCEFEWLAKKWGAEPQGNLPLKR